MKKENITKEILEVIRMSIKFKHALEERLITNAEIRQRLNNGQQCQELLKSIGQ
tara:strand:+ start:235 stop:396 length:162 start_codon:yes stop_codon:yes gene_type:complete